MPMAWEIPYDRGTRSGGSRNADCLAGGGRRQGPRRAWRAAAQPVGILPVPSDGLRFLGGEASAICFDEVRCCYLNGSHLAVVLLCTAYIERELAAGLYAAGWNNAERAPDRCRDGLRLG